MRRRLKLLSILGLTLLVPQLAFTQWAEQQQGQLVIQNGKIGPTGPDDHADWELEIRPLQRD